MRPLRPVNILLRPLLIYSYIAYAFPRPTSFSSTMICQIISDRTHLILTELPFGSAIVKYFVTKCLRSEVFLKITKSEEVASAKIYLSLYALMLIFTFSIYGFVIIIIKHKPTFFLFVISPNSFFHHQNCIAVIACYL